MAYVITDATRSFLKQLWSFVYANAFKHPLVFENISVNIMTLKVLSPVPCQIVPCDYFTKLLNSGHTQFAPVNVHLV